MKKDHKALFMALAMTALPCSSIMAEESHEAEASANETENRVGEELKIKIEEPDFNAFVKKSSGALMRDEEANSLIAYPNDPRNTRENPYYNWKRDFTFAGVPIFLSSFIIKGQKKAFRSARMSMDNNWHSEWDNYTQFAPYAAIVGMKALGYEGRSD